jgi:hypothetical protein
MLRLVFLISAVLAASPADAKCHLFSVWHYPWPQRCGVARQMVRLQIPANSRKPVSREKSAIQFPTDAPDIALPSLARTDCDGGLADEPTRARLLLRAALEAADAR